MLVFHCPHTLFTALVMYFHWLCFPQRGPGRYWPLCWPFLVLVSAWPTPTWRCRRTRMSSQNLCHFLTCASAPRWVSNSLHQDLRNTTPGPIQKWYGMNITVFSRCCLYLYVNVWFQKFPWGDGNHSLFHNSHTNPLPDGFEGSHHWEDQSHFSAVLCCLFKTSVCSVLGLIILTEGPSSTAIKRCTQTRINPLLLYYT